MTKEEAIRKLKEETRSVDPNQEFKVRRMEPEDAWGVARCFYSVYGENYPFDFYYIPERLIEENRRKSVLSVVARTAKGEILGCAALFRSSALYSRVYEIGQFIILPEFRSTLMAVKIQQFILESLIPHEEIDVVFGESVCHHVVTQKMGARVKHIESALEIGLMPANAYPREDFPNDRVSTLLQFQTLRDQNHELYLPREYAEQLKYILTGFDLSRKVHISDMKTPSGLSTRLLTQFYDFAQVGRFNIQSSGSDLAQVLDAAQAQADQRGIVVRQAFVNLGEPWSGESVSLLRRMGYFFGGFLPRWFDTDGLLMQKVASLPSFDSIQLYSERAKRILDFIRKDIEDNEDFRRKIQ